MDDVVEIDHSVVVYGIIEGPIHSSDIPYWDEDDDCWMLVCQVENGFGGLEVEELTFWTFDDAYEVVKHFKSKCTPFEMEVEFVADSAEEFFDR